MLGSAAVVVGGTAAGAVGYRLWRDREPAGPPDTDGAGHLVWRNWSGIQSSYPVSRAAPANEDELAARFEVSRATIREAVRGLVEAGYLVRRHGTGTFVTALPRHRHFADRAVHDVTERAWLKEFLDGWLARVPLSAMSEAAE